MVDFRRSSRAISSPERHAVLKTGAELALWLLPHQDSNLECLNQNQKCCRLHHGDYCADDCATARRRRRNLDSRSPWRQLMRAGTVEGSAARAAGDVDDLAGDEAGAFAGEERGGGRCPRAHRRGRPGWRRRWPS